MEMFSLKWKCHRIRHVLSLKFISIVSQLVSSPDLFMFMMLASLPISFWLKLVVCILPLSLILFGVMKVI